MWLSIIQNHLVLQWTLLFCSRQCHRVRAMFSVLSQFQQFPLMTFICLVLLLEINHLLCYHIVFGTSFEISFCFFCLTMLFFISVVKLLLLMTNMKILFWLFIILSSLYSAEYFDYHPLVLTKWMTQKSKSIIKWFFISCH